MLKNVDALDLLPMRFFLLQSACSSGDRWRDSVGFLFAMDAQPTRRVIDGILWTCEVVLESSFVLCISSGKISSARQRMYCLEYTFLVPENSSRDSLYQGRQHGHKYR